MKKISYTVIDKIKEKNLTKKEIDFLLYISNFQNDMGVIDRIYYKNICDAINISHQAFYDIKDSLESKDILRATKNHLDPDKYWSFYIYDNKFTHVNDFKKGYVSANYQIFSNDKFLNLKKSEKIFIIELIKRFGYTKRTTIKWSILKIKKFLNIKYDREVFNIFKNIKDLLSFYMTEIIISKKNVVSINKSAITLTLDVEDDIDSINYIERIIERKKINASKEEKQDLLRLFKCNFKKHKNKLKQMIDLVSDVKGEFEVKLINSLMNLKKPFEEIYNGYNY